MAAAAARRSSGCAESSSQWHPLRKPNQNAYIESFNGRLRDECLNEQATSLAHAQVIIETWRCEYNHDRPEKGLGGLTPAAYARQLMNTSYSHRRTLNLLLLKTGGRRRARVTAGGTVILCGAIQRGAV